MALHRRLRGYSGSVHVQDAESMYITRPVDRLRRLASSSVTWAPLLGSQSVTVNGDRFHGLPRLRGPAVRRARELARTTQGAIIHGDLGFANILVSHDRAALRLIDPRGRFGVRGLYGDPRYDMGKLRHCAVDGYDLIIAGRFNLVYDRAELELRLQSPEVLSNLGETFDEAAAGEGYDIDEIIFIEGLHFLSMIPHHAENRIRQLALFATGIRLLNTALC